MVVLIKKGSKITFLKMVGMDKNVCLTVMYWVKFSASNLHFVCHLHACVHILETLQVWVQFQVQAHVLVHVHVHSILLITNSVRIIIIVSITCHGAHIHPNTGHHYLPVTIHVTLHVTLQLTTIKFLEEKFFQEIKLSYTHKTFTHFK